MVVTDVRGTGASDGAWRWPWSVDEVRDMGPVIDWIVAQKWSDGTVGATGVSYEGTTALLAAAVGRPALKAVLARQIEWLLVDETIAPGGVRNVAAPDRKNAKGLRSWSTAPLSTPLKVIGAGRMNCRVHIDSVEAALHVYVESVDDKGHVRLLTEGALRLHKDSARDVTVRIRPVAFELPAGWALRFSIAGADATTFERIPAAGSATLTLDARVCALALPTAITM